MIESIEKGRLPVHIAIIMDGNGRWAKKRRLPRIAGHKAGAKAVKAIVKACGELGIKVLTLYAFSVENWLRPKTEVNALMSLLKEYLKKEVEELNDNNVKLMISGRVKELPKSVQKEISKALESTAGNTGLILNLAINYGSRTEIIDAIKNISNLISKGLCNIQDINEDIVNNHLYTAGLPDPDLLIRTSNEMRLSNFLLWQMAYTEVYFTDVLWPNFDKKELVKAINEYQRRERRYGKVRG